VRDDARDVRRTRHAIGESMDPVSVSPVDLEKGALVPARGRSQELLVGTDRRIGAHDSLLHLGAQRLQ
jgi:hypothetical protein